MLHLSINCLLGSLKTRIDCLIGRLLCVFDGSGGSANSRSSLLFGIIDGRADRVGRIASRFYTLTNNLTRLGKLFFGQLCGILGYAIIVKLD